MEDRGFKKLKGKTIKDVRVEAINEVKILCDDGTLFILDSDETHLGLGILNLTKEREKLDAFPKAPRKPRKPPKTQAELPLEKAADDWPFPTTVSILKKNIELPTKK